jgi:hypothetical protein
MTKNIVTARSTITNEQIYIQCKDFKDAFNTAGILNQIELKEHTYKQIRMRSSVPTVKQGYRWISLVKWIGA